MAKSTSRKSVDRQSLKSTLGSEQTFTWAVVVLVIVCVALTVVIVRFIDSVHYNNQITKLNQQISNQQTQLSSQQKDIKYLVAGKQVNCYQLQSSYSHSICKLIAQ